MTRRNNRIIAYLDQVTMEDRIARDDVSAVTVFPLFSEPQIATCLRLAVENNAVNLTAALLDCQNKSFPRHDSLDDNDLTL